MNRKDRRAAAKRARGAPAQAPASAGASTIVDLVANANRCFQQGQSAHAQAICQQILAREPAHIEANNLLGLIAQAEGGHRRAVNHFATALAADKLNAACHYHIASSYLRLSKQGNAAAHFKKAIVLGLSGKTVEEIILQSPAVVACVDQAQIQWPLPLQTDAFFGPAGIAPFVNDIFLQTAMESVLIRGLLLEVFLTHLRLLLLRLASPSGDDSRETDGSAIRLFAALAQQCFINEYVFACDADETAAAARLRDFVSERMRIGGEVPPLVLVAVAAYFPLHTLPNAEALLAGSWPEPLAGLLRQQIREPLEEFRDREAIPALTAVDDGVSLLVMQQYEQNPYPRWTVNPQPAPAGGQRLQAEMTRDGEHSPQTNILIAGCGTGRHAFQTAQVFPDARILAVDISLASLAYARRKTREEGLRNIEYAQADILKLGTLGRSFDRIESVGVLHHLEDPKEGWRVLVSLLRPGGKMRIGLYSEKARRSIVEARALIAERGYRATADDIRRFRQDVARVGDEQRWRVVATASEFYCMSGCRDLLFNVMENRFTIPQIKEILGELGLSFIRFHNLRAEVIEKFQRQFPGLGAAGDLDNWHTFETANPETFVSMYLFSVSKH